ncbi:hypothetical protein BCR34DRAFT_519492 [Clohesyomyces aquaticus]|uniref:Zn(2)-C6 fungal-type domain-containing protein n=1 Tax=Clohesyomyces aquaticus TaxID=1231657 RepID=A0A1Y1Z5M1_9PLEO|nr:hypothetical protein BCR34DRAFT_519492 [Clohesyomyces aquaticus]
MSYRGRPSKGCDSCRARKVKCDETKPACDRCNKSGHDCRYRDQSDLMFKNQTASAAQKAEESWRKRSKSNQREERDVSSHGSNVTTHQTPPSDQSSPNNDWLSSDLSGPLERLTNLSVNNSSIPPDLHRLAYERFLYDWVALDTPRKDPSETSDGIFDWVTQNTPSADPSEPSDGIFDWIPPLYQRSARGSCFASVVDALAYLNFSCRCNFPQAQGLAEESIGKSIKLLQAAIADPIEAKTDSTLGAVYLMGVYENLSSPVHNGSFLAHKEGANALLKLRTMEEFYSDPISTRLYEVSYAQMLIGNLQTAKPPPLDMRRMDLPTPVTYSVSGIYVMQMIHNVTSLNAEWHATKQATYTPQNRESLRRLLQTALDIDGRYQSWEDSLPSLWRYSMELNTPEVSRTFDPKWQSLFLNGRGAPKEIHTYSSLKRVWIWNFYRTSRMFLMRVLLEIINWMLRLPEPEPEPGWVVDTDDPLSDTNSPPSSFIPQAERLLDSVTLRTHHAFATTNLVRLMEKSCSAIMSHFTAPLWGKSPDDISGIRGYTPFWGLGVMNAILMLGLIPDSGPPPSGDTDTPSTEQHLVTVPDVIIDHVVPSASESASVIYTHVLGVPGSRSKLPFTAINQVPNDFVPGNLASEYQGHFQDFSITKIPSIDVAGRQEWIHRVLYYLGTELGIKKALAMLRHQDGIPGWKPA